MRQLDKRTVLWISGAVAAAGLAYRPGKIFILLLLPFIITIFLVTAFLLHIVLSYFAASRSAYSDRRATQPVVPLLSIATEAGLEAIRVRKLWMIENTSLKRPLHPTSPAVSAALDRLLAVILDNHLISWYAVSISPSDPSFQNAVEKVIRETLISLRDKLVNVDWANLGVSTVLPRITSHLVLFQEAQQSLLETSGSANSNNGLDGISKDRKKKQSLSANPASEEFDLLLSNKYAELAGQAGLHDAVSGASFNSRPSEEKHLRKLIARILELIMPERESGSSAVMVLTMDVVACAIIRPIMEVISDPDLWNRLLDDKAGSAIREQ